MAEAIAAIGAIASVMQLVEYGSRILKRLEEYQSKLGELPEAFRHIKAELPVLLDALKKTKAAIEAGSIQDESKAALIPAVEGCQQQIKTLDDVIVKALPASGDSWARRSRKALGSLRYDAKVEKIVLVIRGYIQTLTYHAAAASSLASIPGLRRPTPCSTVPFRRDPCFVDSKIIAEIEHKSQQPASRVALVGLGGVGKSQLAVEYSYRVREKSPATWVFWVHASTTERFREGYRNIAERAMLAGWDQPDKDVLRPVYSWLCDETNRWVMIVDNADDLDVFRSSASESHAHDFLKFLPQSPNGSILITSRSRDAAFRMTGSYTDILRVDPMGQERALSLLRNKLGNFEKSDGIQLVEALDFMPLAITQAAAYISQRAPRATLPSYLQSIRNGDRDRAKLLDTDMADSRRDGTSSNSVIATWQISFEHIRRETPSATRLLSLMSLFDRQGIPESLLVGQYQDDADFETDLSVLTDFSLVGVDVDGDQFKMHRLVQFSTRKWMELQGELEGWGKTYVDIMSRNYPLGDFENWKVCQALFPHAQAALACRPADGDALLRWATLLFNAARYAADTGDYNTAAEMLRASLEAREAVLPKDHRKTLFAAMNLGQMLAEQVKYAEAEEILRRTNEIAEQAFGLEDLLTLSASCTLGHVLTLQQKYDEAEGILRQVLTISEKLLGQDNLFTLGVASNLGLALAYQGKYGEAEASIRGVVQTREKLLGPEHPVLIRGTIRLGCVLYFQRRHDEAEIVFRKALDTSERVLGRDHPDTLLSAKSLADVLWSLSRHKPALELYQRAYDGFVRTLGSDHRGTIRCREDCLKAEEFMARKSNDSLSPEPVAEFLFESLTQVD